MLCRYDKIIVIKKWTVRIVPTDHKLGKKKMLSNIIGKHRFLSYLDFNFANSSPKNLAIAPIPETPALISASEL